MSSPSSTMETQCSTAAIESAVRETRKRCSRLRTSVRMACSNPSEYRAAATRSQMTLISAIRDSQPSSVPEPPVYLAGYRGRAPQKGGTAVDSVSQLVAPAVLPPVPCARLIIMTPSLEREGSEKSAKRGRAHYSPSFQSSGFSHGDASTKTTRPACTASPQSHHGALAQGHSSVADGADRK